MKRRNAAREWAGLHLGPKCFVPWVCALYVLTQSCYMLVAYVLIFLSFGSKAECITAMTKPCV